MNKLVYATPAQALNISSLIAENIKGEGDARMTQTQLMLAPGLSAEDKATVAEITADEINHALKYEAMFRKYSGILATSDGALEAVEAIGKDLPPTPPSTT